jgi:acyl-CoA dehydrogenase
MSGAERAANMAELLATVERIGLEVARPSAADVDARARFPSETLDALRGARALSAAVPDELGGGSATLSELSRMCTALAQHCASSGMVLAMHHIQVLSIANHAAGRPQLAEYLGTLAREQRLVASVTSEVGPSGDMRRSVAAVESRGDRCTLMKRATTVSYGAHADDLLITARRAQDAAASDQVLLLAPRGSYKLSDVGAWDTLGMRGTCSPGCTVHVETEAFRILPEPFGEIATYTMVPTSHILWSSCWLGIATDAVSKAQAVVRAKGRAEPGVVPRAAQRLSEIYRKLQGLRDEVATVAREYDAAHAGRDKERLASLGFALRINNLKLTASTAVVDIVGEALGICGIAAYKNDSQLSLGRQLRDAHSAALMISNDRIHDTNASLLLVHKGN